MAAPICSPAGPGVDELGRLIPNDETLKVLGLRDSAHDWCDLKRVKERLARGIKLKLIPASVNIEASANKICSQIGTIFSTIIPTCSLPPDEDALLQILYGVKQRLTDRVISNFSNRDQHYALAQNLHNETHIPYSEVKIFIEKMLNIPSIGRLLMDVNKISPELCSFKLPDGRKPGVNTIAKAYDRTTTNEDDYCNELDDMRDIVSNPVPVLTKVAGELFFFDAIYITGDMTMEWQATGATGIINIQNMIDIKSSDQIENLTTAILAFLNGLSGAALIAKNKTTDIIKYCYGLDIATFNINQYLLALTDLKRLGDLLQIKLAQIRNYTFVSTDRVSIAIASYGYGIRCLRTSLASSSGDSIDSSDDDAMRSNRVIAFYNFPDIGGGLEAYYQDMLDKYYTYTSFLQTLYESISPNQSIIGNLYEIYDLINRFLIPYFEQLELDPFNITSVTAIRASRHTTTVSDSPSPTFIIKDIFLQRIIYIYLQLVSKVIYSLSILIQPKFSSFLLNIDNIYRSTSTSVQEKFNQIKEEFIKNKIPLLNTLIKITTDRDRFTKLYNHINIIYNILNDTTTEYSIKLEKTLKYIDQDIDTISLFGFTDTIKEYISTMVSYISELKDTAYTANLGETSYKVSVIKKRSPQSVRNILNEYEKYINQILKDALPSSGGNKTKKLRKKIKGGDFKLLTQPDDAIDLAFAKLITQIYLEPSNKDLLVLYMQLALITDQFNISLQLVCVADEIDIQKSKIVSAAAPARMDIDLSSGPQPLDIWATKQSYGPPTDLQSDYSPSGPPPWPSHTLVAATAGGGNKKSKQPVKGGKSKKEDKKKDEQPVKGGKSKKEDKKKDEQPVKGGKSKKEMKENAKTKKNAKSDDKKK